MADDKPDYYSDDDLMPLSREFYDKRVGDCNPGELRALIEIRDSRRRLRKIDKFLAGFR